MAKPGDNDRHRRAGELPAKLRRRADVQHQVAGRCDRRNEQSDVVPGHAVERCRTRRREDQERERQHAENEQVEIFGVELRVADEEAQRELLVDAEEDGRAGRDDQQPAPDAGEPAHADDFGLDRRGLRMRIGELDLRSPPAFSAMDIGIPPSAPGRSPAPADQNTGSWPILFSAALRASIQALVKAALSSGGLLFRKSAQAACQRLLPLEELLVVRLVLGLPHARLLERLHRALVIGDHPGEVLPVEREAGRARRRVLVGVVVSRSSPW